MKKLIPIILILICNYSFAAHFNYYVSASGDNTTGLSPAHAWTSITTLNTKWAGTIVAGDSIFFNRGETFYGTIAIAKSGTAGNPIVLSAYGTGATPILTGFTTISGWTSEGGGIYSKVITAASKTNMVTLDGAQVGMGRFPDVTYTTYTGGNVSKIWVNGMGSATNWTGANVVIRKNDFIIENDAITNQVGDTLYYTGANNTELPTNNFGLFITNDLRTLTTYGEWYHNTATGKFYMYFGTINPTLHTVQVATLNSVITNNTYDYVTVQNLNIQGSINNAIDFTANNDHCTIQNDSVFFAGKYGIYFNNGVAANLIDNNAISYCNNLGVYTVSNTSASITNNRITNIGRIIGQGLDKFCAGMAINTYGTNLTIRYNTIRGCGYDGIYTSPSGPTIIQYNLIDSTCLNLDDGGAIYTSGNSIGNQTIYDHNIITNVLGNRAGTNTPLGNSLSGGIYLDQPNSRLKVTSNSISNCGYYAIKVHRGATDTIRGNTGFNNRVGIDFTDYTGNSIRSNFITQNIFVAKLTTQYVLDAYDVTSDISLWGIVDSNYYCRPIAENTSFFLHTVGYTNITKTLAQWQTISGLDAHSRVSPKTIANTTELKYDYNFSAVPVKSSFTGLQYMDILGALHNNADTIQPYSARVLWSMGTVPPSNPVPVVSAGANQTITLPTNSVTLSGSATDDGTIVSHTWTKISGPSGGAITAPLNYITSATSLLQGIYLYELEAVDNLGGVGYDTMQVTVNPAPVNVLPVANAGVDKTIVLPTNSTSATGTATDADGTITGVTWAFVSGPTTATFGTPNALTTTINSLTIAGTYVISFTAVDNSGGSAADFMQVIVKAANVAPTANAGLDQTITLPTSSITLTGSGTDVDGTITGYLWTQLSGPVTASITSATSATTGVTGLSTAGTYIFQLRVTDNLGLTGVDAVQITVNPAIPPPNVPPTANAGVNQSITLPTNFTTLSGSGTDPDGVIVSYLWTKISGGAVVIVGATSATTNITSMVAGSYQFKLRVTDNLGDTGVATMQVTVNAANVPPSVNAGVDQSITLPTNIAHLTATVSDIDGTIASTIWTKISGPSGGTISLPTSVSTDVISLVQGTYIYQIKAFDNKGDSATDAVQITVLAAPVNVPPSCYAGVNQTIVQPATTGTLTGTASDTDGYIFSYRWAFISGPVTPIISSPSAASSGVTGLNLAGNYTFLLTVTDNAGATASSSVQLSVVTSSSGNLNGKKKYRP